MIIAQTHPFSIPGKTTHIGSVSNDIPSLINSKSHDISHINLVKVRMKPRYPVPFIIILLLNQVKLIGDKSVGDILNI